MTSFFIGLFFTSFYAMAGKVQVPSKHFYMELKHQHGSGEWYRVYQKKGKWICQTESMPYFVAKSEPLAGLNLKQLGKSGDVSECRTQVVIRDKRVSPPQSYSGCADDNKALLDLISQIHDACRAGG
jgi:hypothetical protein